MPNAHAGGFVIPQSPESDPCLVEAPDIATIAKVSVALSARGSTKIETLPALAIEDFLSTLE